MLGSWILWDSVDMDRLLNRNGIGEFRSLKRMDILEVFVRLELDVDQRIDYINSFESQMIGKPKAVDSHLHLWRCCITTASHALGVRLGLWKCATIWREHRCLQLAVLKDFRQASHLTQERCCRAKYFKFSNCSRASCYGRCEGVCEGQCCMFAQCALCVLVSLVDIT